MARDGAVTSRRFFVAVHIGAGYHVAANEKALRYVMKRACLGASIILRQESGGCIDVVSSAIEVLENRMIGAQLTLNAFPCLLLRISVVAKPKLSPTWPNYPDEDEECVVAVKVLGPLISFCRPAQSNPKWTNITIKEEEDPCFHSSRVMFSQTDQAFHMLGSGCHLINSWDLRNHRPVELWRIYHKFKVQPLHFENLDKRELLYDHLGLDLLNSSEYLVESQSTGEMFIVKSYKETTDSACMKTIHVRLFKLDIEQGKAVYTQDIGDLAIFISDSEPLCVNASSFPNNIISPNHVYIWDCGEMVTVAHLSHVKTCHLLTISSLHPLPYPVALDYTLEFIYIIIESTTTSFFGHSYY